MSQIFQALKSFNLYLVIGLAVAALSFVITYGLARQKSDPQPPAVLTSSPDSNKELDGLSGSVHRVRTESARLSIQSGKLVEGPRELLESSTYDPKGKRIDNSYYLVSSEARTAGKEEYAYDAKGNISETTVRDVVNNSILSKEVYTYEFDAVGNWTRMVTSTVIYEKGKLAQQPVEVTYRTITYYFDQAISEIVKLPAAADEKDHKASLRGALNDWVAATNARDIERLMNFYGSKVDVFYRNRNVSSESVRAEKARLFGLAHSIDVRADEPEITLDSDERTATMLFRKQYVIKEKGRDWSGEVLQQLRWQRTDDGWKIVGERDLRVIRRRSQRTALP